MPYSYNPQNDIAEYHILLRTMISTYVKVIFHCINHLTLYDGPTYKSRKLDMDCQEGIISNSTASSFQVYVVYKHHHGFGKAEKLNITFNGVLVGSKRKIIRVGSGDVTFSWNLANTS